MFCGRTATDGMRPVAWAAAAALLVCSCRSDHRVSPWPEDLGMESLVQPPDLQRHLARVEHEMANENLARTDELRGQFTDRTPFVILGFSGTDRVRRPRTALRVATGHGVVLALGPSDSADATRARRTRLVVSLADGGGWRSGTDLNGDGHPDVVVRGDDGALEIWYLMPRGASPYAIRSIVAPDHAVDIDEDGRPELAARVVLGKDDAISPWVLEAAGFEQGAYRNDAAAVKAWHRRVLGELRAQDVPDAGPREERVVLAEAVQEAWHAIRAGEQAAEALRAADAVAAARAPLGPGLAQAWVRWRGWLADLAPR